MACQISLQGRAGSGWRITCKVTVKYASWDPRHLQINILLISFRSLVDLNVGAGPVAQSTE